VCITLFWLSVTVLGDSGFGDLRLVSVHVAIRHGDRSPLHSVPNIVNKPFYCRPSPLHSNQSSILSGFLRKMEEVGHRRHVSSSYAGYSLCPTEDLCGVGSLTQSGVEQHILNGAFLRQFYIAKQKLLVRNDVSFSEQVSL